MDTLSVAGYHLRNKGTRCGAVVACVSNKMIATMRKRNLRAGLAFGPALYDK